MGAVVSLTGQVHFSPVEYIYLAQHSSALCVYYLLARLVILAAAGGSGI